MRQNFDTVQLLKLAAGLSEMRYAVFLRIVLLKQSAFSTNKTWHFELVLNGHAINAELYCEQLDRVYDTLVEKYPSLVRRKRALFQPRQCEAAYRISERPATS